MPPRRRPPDSLAQLVTDGILETVEPDPDAAHNELEMARRHINSVAALTATDPTLAYAGLYDAARKAISAHMRRHGYRPSGGPGKHMKTMNYARIALTDRGIDDALEALDDMRETRHASEYDAAPVGQPVVEHDLAHARAIVDAVAAELGA